MPTLYPAQIDTPTSLPIVANNQTTLNADYFNGLRSAIIAAEKSLGINPGGTSDVATRLTILESNSGGGTTITFGGDLSGNATAQTVVGLQNIPVSSIIPTTSQVLQFNGGAWQAATISTTPSGAAGGDLGGSYPDPLVIAINGITVTGTPTNGQVLTATSGSAAHWSSPISGGISALTGDITASGAGSVVATLATVNGNIGTFGSTTIVPVITVNAKGLITSVGSATLPTSYPPSGPAGGGLSGNYPMPTVNPLSVNGDITGFTSGATVVALQGVPLFNGSPIINQVLEFNGTQWAPATLATSYPPNGAAGGDLSGTYPNPTVAKLQGTIVLSGTAATGLVLTATSATAAHWAAPAGGGFSAGGDLSGTSLSQVVIGIRTNPVSITAPTAGQYLVENSGATGSAWTSLSGDITSSVSTPGQLTVNKIQGVVISGTPTTGQVLEATSSSAATWQTPTTSTTPIYATSLSTLTPPVSDRATVFVDGYTSQYDGGQGYFQWDNTSTLASNGGTIIQVTGVSTGRWMRVYDKNIWVTWFGAKGDGVTDDSAAIQAAINAAGTGGTVYFPRLPQYNGIGLFQSYLVENTLTVLYSQNQNGITFRGDSPAGSSSGFFQVRILFDLTTHTGTTGSITARTTIGGLANNLTLSNIAIPSDVHVGDCLTISGATSVDGNGQLINNGNFTITSVTPGTGTSGAVTYYGYNPQVNFGPITSGTVPDTNNGGITWTIRKNGFLNLAEYTRFENITLQSIGSSVGSLFYSTINTSPVDGNTQCSFEFCEFVGGVFGVNIGDMPPDFPTTPYTVGNCEFYLFNKCDFQSQLYAGVKNNGGEQKGQKFTTCSFQQQPVGLWFWGGSIIVYDVAFEANTVANIHLANGDDTTYICGIQSELSARMFVTGVGNKYGGGGATSYQCILENCRADTDPAHASPDGYFIQWIYNGGLELRNCEFSIGSGGFGSGATPLTICLSGFGNTGVANNAKCVAIITNCGFPNGPGDPIVSCPNLTTFTQFESRGNYCNNGNGVDFAIPNGINFVNVLPIQSVTTNGGPTFSGNFTPNIGSNIIVASANQSEFSGNPNPIVPGMFLTFVTVGAGSFLVETVSNTTPCNIQISTILYPTGYPTGYPGSGSAGTCAAIVGVLPVPEQQLQLVTPVTTQTIANSANVNLPNNGFYLMELTGGGASASIAGMIYLGVNGQTRKLINLTGSQITISNENSSETAPWNRFHNPNGIDVNFSISVTVYYSSSLMRWVVTDSDFGIS